MEVWDGGGGDGMMGKGDVSRAEHLMDVQRTRKSTRVDSMYTSASKSHDAIRSGQIRLDQTEVLFLRSFLHVNLSLAGCGTGPSRNWCETVRSDLVVDT